RFPILRFAMWEGGVGWACSLFTDLIAHWQKRNPQALMTNTRPANIDTAMMADLFRRYGGKVYEEKMDELLGCLSMAAPFMDLEASTARESLDKQNDFAAAQIESEEGFRAQFTEQLYFGCETDDVITAWAFDRHGNRRLNPIFSSDIGHFDVVDMQEVLEEAYELVEHKLITEDDFREFVFGNIARLHTSMNPNFFKGTIVEEAVA